MTKYERPKTPPKRRRRRLRACFTEFTLLTHYCEICQGPLTEDVLGERICLHCAWTEPNPEENENA